MQPTSRAIILSSFILACAQAPETPPPPAATFSVDTTSIEAPGVTATNVARAAITPQFLEAVRQQPVLGRSFVADDYQSGNPVAMISYELWRSQFGAQPTIIGQSVTIGGEAVVIVGILPRGFAQPEGTNVWMPANAVQR
ncbi:MAG: ABC transporter permease [Longimicrobiales bacterium]